MRDRTLAGLVIGTMVVALVLGVTEWLFRGRAPRRRSPRELFTDVCYWFLTPLVTRAFTRLFVGVVVVLVAIAAGFGGGASGGKSLVAAIGERSPISTLPLGAQLALGIVIADFCGYWQHRLFHASRFWRFHAVHHSSSTLDWLAASRIHPVNDLVAKLVLTLPLLALGFDAKVFAGVAPLLTLHAIFLHADVPWSFGKLGYVISSPRFHRWHHTSEAEGLDKNFAGLLPLWDLVFGTFHLPDHAPERFGIREDLPEGVWGQLLWPFRRASPPADASASSPDVPKAPLERAPS